MGRADENHLEVEGDRFGTQGGGGDGRELLADVLDGGLAAAQGALQGVPHEGAGEHVNRLHDQKTAVGAVNGAGLDEGEVGERAAGDRLIFEPAEEVVVDGVVLGHDGGAVLVFVGDEHVDAIAGRQLLLGLPPGPRREIPPGARRCPRPCDRGSARWPRCRRTSGVQFLERSADGGHGVLPVEIVHPSLGFLLQFPRLGERFADALADLLHAFFQRVAIFLGELARTARETWGGLRPWGG